MMKRKRILSLLLVFLLCFNVLPVFASDDVTLPEGATFYYQYVISDADYDAGVRFDESYYEKVKTKIENGEYVADTIIDIELSNDEQSMILYLGSAAGTEVGDVLQPFEETQPEVDTGSTLSEFNGWTGVDTSGNTQILSPSYYIGSAVQTYYGQNNTTFTSGGIKNNYGFTYTLTIGEGQSFDEDWYSSALAAIEARTETGVVAIEKSADGKTLTLYFDTYNFYKTTLRLPDVTLADTSDTLFDNAWSDGDSVLDITKDLSVHLAYTDSGNTASIYATNLNLSPVIATKTYTIHIDLGESGSLITIDDYAKYVTSLGSASGYTVSADEGGDLVISGFPAGAAGFSVDESVIEINDGKMLDGFELDTSKTDSAVSCSIAYEDDKWQFTDFTSSDMVISHDIYVTAVYADIAQLYVPLPDGARVNQSGIDTNSDIIAIDNTHTSEGYLIITAKKGTTISIADILIYDGFYTTTTVAAGQDGTSLSSMAAVDWIEITDATVTPSPSALDLTYTGEAQALVTVGTVSGGTIYYSLTGDEDSWSENVPTAKDAGTYTVYYKVIADDYHNSLDPVQIEAEIAKATPSVTEPPARIATVGQKLSEVELPTGWAWEDGTASLDSAGVNLFSAIYTPDDTANYNTVTADLSVTVEAAADTDSKAVLLTLDQFTVDMSEETYTGNEITKKVTSSTLTEGTDYTVSYSGNRNAGTAAITVTGIGDYSGTLNYNFIISKADPTYTIPAGLTATAGQTLSEVKLTDGWSWEDGSAGVGSTGVKLFRAVYTPDDTDNYNTVTVNLTVTVEADANASLKSLTVDDFAVDVDPVVYTGAAITKNIESGTLKEGTDYLVFYSDNTEVGVAVITIAGTGSYTGTLTYNFIIEQVDGESDIPDNLPDVSSLKATVGQSLSDVVLPNGWTWEADSESVGNEGVKLFRAVYSPTVTASYNTQQTNRTVLTANSSAGTAYYLTVKVTAGSNSASPASLALNQFEVDMNSVSYTGNATTKEIVNNANMVEGKDYLVFYSENTDAGTAVITIVGTGSYTGTLTYNYIIEPVDVTNDPTYTEPINLTVTAGKTLSDVTLPEGWTWEDDTVSVGSTGVKLFRAVYTPKDTDNYSTVTAYLTVTVEAIPLTHTHSLTHGKAKDATCTETGNSEYWYCTECGKYFSDSSGLLETSLSSVTIATKGHDWGPTEYRWSDDGKGCTATRICETDSSHVEEATATVTGEETKAASCTENGETTYTAVFSESWASEQTKVVADISATGHNYEAGAVVASTYEEQGYTVYTCTYCGDSYEADYTAVKVIDGTDGNLSTRTTVQELTAVPEGLKSLYSGVDALIADLISRVTAGTGYTADNALVYDVVLQYSTDGGITWITATVDNFPTTGITVTIPYPEGTDSSYEFVVEHMFTVTSERLGITAGETERPTITKTEDGLVVTLMGLSPVAVSWKAEKTAATETETTDTSSQTDNTNTDISGTSANSTVSAQTGDNSSVALWLALLSVSGVGLIGAAAYNRKRKYSR